MAILDGLFEAKKWQIIYCFKILYDIHLKFFILINLQINVINSFGKPSRLQSTKP